MRTLTWGLGLTALTAPLWAAVGGPTGPPLHSPLVALAGTLADELEDEYEDLLDAFGEAQSAWYAKLNAAAEGDQGRIFNEENPTKDFLPRFQDLAERAGTSGVALDSWLWVFSNASQKKAKLAALATLLEDHLQSKELTSLASSLRYTWSGLGRAPVEDAFEQMALTSPHPSVQAAAWFGVAQLYAAYEEDEAALESARKVLEDYANEPVSEDAKRLLFELERLQVGMEAPEYVAVDQVGVEFKLSDYEGKVVLLDFWGFW